MKKFCIGSISLLLIFSFCIIITKINTYNKFLEEHSIPVYNQTEKVIYLTFDDGPSSNTREILNILEKYEISATFFVVGPSYTKKDDLLKEILNNGHYLAIHSYNHIYSQIYSNKEEYITDFTLCLEWIKKTTNMTPYLYRFPGGSSNTIASKQLILDIIDDLSGQGYKHVDWNVDSLDSKYSTNSNNIIKQTINDINKNESNNIYTQIILMHDNTKKVATVESLATIIEYCLSKGYIFKPLTLESPLIQHLKSPNGLLF